MRGVATRVAIEAVLIGLGVVVGKTLAWVVVGLGSLFLAVETTRRVREWRRDRKNAQAPRQGQSGDLAAFAQMIEEGRALAGDEFGGSPSWGQFVSWRNRVAEEVEHKRGAVEKQRLLEVKPLQGTHTRDHVLAVVEWLRGQRDRAESPPAPGLGEFGRRDDRGELAQRCHMLAGSVERWVESFKNGHSQRAEKLVDEWLAADAETDPAEARLKAYTRDEKTWETDYRLKYEREAREVFRRAWEMHEVAKEHEQLATAPVAIQFEEVSKLFNTIAERLYSDG